MHLPGDIELPVLAVSCSQPDPLLPISIRFPGTPNEKLWPGVTQLPDYKTAFPVWAPQELSKVVTQLDSEGHAILAVSRMVSEISVLRTE